MSKKAETTMTGRYRLYTAETQNDTPEERDCLYQVLELESFGLGPNKIYRIALIERLSDNSYIIANGLQFHEDTAIDWDYGHYFGSGQLTKATIKYSQCIKNYIK